MIYSPRAESSSPPVLHPDSDNFGGRALLRASANGVLRVTSTAMVGLICCVCGGAGKMQDFFCFCWLQDVVEEKIKSEGERRTRY